MGGARQATSTAQPEQSNFVPWSRFVGANKDVSERNAAQLQAGAQGEINHANAARDAATSSFNKTVESNYTPVNTGPKASANASAKKATAWGNIGPSQGAPGQVPQQGMAVGAGFGGLTDAARDNGPQGAPDLEQHLGEQAWGKLLGDTAKAQQDATALGSESGVEAMLQKQGAAPNSAFDAALVSGAGGKGFQETAKSAEPLGNQLAGAAKDSQTTWGKLLGDVDKARFDKTATDEANTFNSNRAQEMYDREHQPTDPAAEAAAKAAEAPTPKKATNWDQIDDVLYPDGQWRDMDRVMGEIHRAGMTMSGADWAMWAAGEGGADIPLASELYVLAVMPEVKGLNAEQVWTKAKIKMAYTQSMYEYGEEAALEFLSAMMNSPDMINAYMGMKNPGFMASQMRAWLESAGWQKQRGTGQAQADSFWGKGAKSDNVHSKKAPSGPVSTATTDSAGGVKIPSFK